MYGGFHFHMQEVRWCRICASWCLSEGATIKEVLIQFHSKRYLHMEIIQKTNRCESIRIHASLPHIRKVESSIVVHMKIGSDEDTCFLKIKIQEKSFDSEDR